MEQFLKNALQTKYKTSACHLFAFTKEFFLLSLVIISVWWKWVGNRNVLGNIKISPWKCHYRLGIKVAIVLISISKKRFPWWKPSLRELCGLTANTGIPFSAAQLNLIPFNEEFLHSLTYYIQNFKVSLLEIKLDSIFFSSLWNASKYWKMFKVNPSRPMHFRKL